MSWIVIALFAPVLGTFVNFIDKYLLGEKVQDYRVLPMLSGIVGALAGIVLLLWRQEFSMSIQDTSYLLIAGLLGFFSLYYYFKALDFEQTSIVIFLFQASPLITLVIAWFFLHEVISGKQLIGFFLILGASLIISGDKVDKKSFKISRSFYYIMLSNFFWSCGEVLYKYIAENNDFTSTLAVESFGIFLGAVLVYMSAPDIRRACQKAFPSVSKRTWGLLSFNEILAVISKWLVFWAVILGPVALVDVVVSIQVFYAFVAGWVLTVLFPKIFNENISSKGLMLKFFCGVVLCIGLYLVS